MKISQNLLLSVIVVQFVFILYLLSLSHEEVHHSEAHTHTLAGESALQAARAETAAEMEIFFEDVPRTPQIPDAAPKGVAAVILLHAPKWFQRRYTLMIQNVYNNLPEGWVIQLFYLPGEGQSQAGLDINIHLSGKDGMIPSGKVLLTEIPVEIFQRYKKRVELLQSPWLWKKMLADKVFLFGGTGVICSNSAYKLQDFAHFDWIGGPWNQYNGMGGDGGISIRSRPLMLQVLQYEARQRFLQKRERKEGKDGARRTDTEAELNKNILSEDDLLADYVAAPGPDDRFFISRIQEMFGRGIISPQTTQVATAEDCMKFQASQDHASEFVLTSSGTLPGLTDKEREDFMRTCPEMKWVYPSLHNPACFGSHVDPVKCQASICALKKGLESHHSC